MRKEIGQRVRKLLFAGIPQTLPGFALSKEGGIPGHYWVGRLWSREDVWWRVAPAVHTSADLHDVDKWMSRSRLSLDETLGRVEANVEDALRKLHDHLGPWLEGRSKPKGRSAVE